MCGWGCTSRGIERSRVRDKRRADDTVGETVTGRKG